MTHKIVSHTACVKPNGLWRKVRLATFLCAVTLGVMAAELPDLGDSAQAVLTPQMENRIGEEIMNEIRLRDPAYVDDPEILDYLNTLGARLAASSNDPTQHFRFFAIADNSINAFAFFGGYIGVNTGLILESRSESELAGVLSHEISHVTQHHFARMIAKSQQDNLLGLAAFAAAILLAQSSSSSSSNMAQAAAISAQAGMVQSQLAFSRDFEREADRIGFETLQQSGFDAHGMASFFQRLQRNTRLYENNATTYIATHPLTTDRIADMTNRDQKLPYRQVADSLDYLLVRARLQAQGGTTPKAAITEFERQIRERKTSSEAASRYGLAVAALRARDTKTAIREVEALRAMKASSPMIDSLDAEVKIAAGDPEGALPIYRDALQHYPNRKALMLGYAETLLKTKRASEAERFLKQAVENDRTDDRLFALLAQSYAEQNKRLLQHQAQGETYVLRGQLDPAIDQFQLAQKAGDGDFYQKSSVDARLRELRQLKMERAKEGNLLP